MVKVGLVRFLVAYPEMDSHHRRQIDCSEVPASPLHPHPIGTVGADQLRSPRSEAVELREKNKPFFQVISQPDLSDQ